MAKNKFKVGKKQKKESNYNEKRGDKVIKSTKKQRTKKLNKNKDRKEELRKGLNSEMDQLVKKTNLRTGAAAKALLKPAKTFQKIGLPTAVKTDDIENLIKKL